LHILDARQRVPRTYALDEVEFSPPGKEEMRLLQRTIGHDEPLRHLDRDVSPEAPLLRVLRAVGTV